jgi:hypothetical protein
MKKATLTAILSCSFFYLLTGLIGYVLYGNSVKPNFLLMLQKDQIHFLLYFGMNLGFLISIFFSFSVMFFSSRNNFIAIMKLLLSKNTRKNR